MKFDLTLGLADRPGQLLRALEPIAKNGGNIISILHDRGKTTGEYIPVSLVVDFPAAGNLRKAMRELEALGVSIIRSEEIGEKASVTFILTGRLDMGRVTAIEGEGARILDLEASEPTSEEACVKLVVEAPEAAVPGIVKRLKDVAREGGAVLIYSV